MRAYGCRDRHGHRLLAGDGGCRRGGGLPVGLLEPGRRFDAVVFDLDAPGGVIRHLALDDEARRFEKLVRLAGPHDIAEVWVDGVSVHRR